MSSRCVALDSIEEHVHTYTLIWLCVSPFPFAHVFVHRDGDDIQAEAAFEGVESDQQSLSAWEMFPVARPYPVLVRRNYGTSLTALFSPFVCISNTLTYVCILHHAAICMNELALAIALLTALSTRAPRAWFPLAFVIHLSLYMLFCQPTVLTSLLTPTLCVDHIVSTCSV